MTDELEATPEVAEEVVRTEADQVEASEETESTEGDPEREAAVDPEGEAEKERKSRNERRKEAKERAQQALRDAEAKRAEAEAKLQQVREAAKTLPRPKQDDYADYEDYQAALSAYHNMTMMDRREAQRIEAEARQHYEQSQQIRKAQAAEDDRNWSTQMDEARTRYPDFDSVALRPDVPITQEMAAFIKQSDVAADLAYYIGKNVAVGQQMARMSEVEMARAIGRLEAQLSAPKPKTVTSAPDPITPVRGKSTASKDHTKMTQDEFNAWREAGGSF